jgi:hypothetical protein
MPAPRALAIGLLSLFCAACGSGAVAPSGAALPDGWRQYSDDEAGFSVDYPGDTLAASRQDTALVLTHSIAYLHPNPCDFRGDGGSLGDLTDFRVTFDVLEKGLTDAITDTEGSDYVVSTYFPSGSLRAPDETVGRASFGGLSGYRVTSGVEGCGRTAYYFTTPTGRTLVVTRQSVPEFTSGNANTDDILDLPGVLRPEDGTALFERIMGTVRFAGGQASAAG